MVMVANKAGTVQAIKPGTVQMIKDNLQAVKSLRLITESDCPEEIKGYNDLLVRVAARYLVACNSFNIK